MKLSKFNNLKFQSYKPGKYEIPNLKKISKIVKLSANESALGASPKVKAILRKDNSLKIKEGETGYFLINLSGRPSKGSIRTSGNFGLLVKNGAYIPKALLLPIEKFFKNPILKFSNEKF